MGSIVLNRCSWGGVRLYLALECATSVYRGPTQLQNDVMPDFASTHQKVQLSPAMYHPMYQNRQLKDLKMIKFHRDHKVLQIVTKELACQLWETYSMAAVCIRGVRMEVMKLITLIIVSDVGEAVFTRSRQHWRSEARQLRIRPS